MPERTEYAPGTPSWVDVQTADQAAAKDFYHALFGWEYDDQPAGPDGVYSIATKGGRPVAAIAPLPTEPPGVPPHWNTYVTVADVDATTSRVPGAGGQVLVPAFDVMDAGRMAVVTDPTGATLCLWQPKNHIGAQLVNEPGTLTWNELTSPDIPRAAEFYAAVLGWTAEAGTGGPIEYTEFKVDGQSIAGGMKPPAEGIPPFWGVYFAVEDCDATVALAGSKGATVLVPPTDIPVGRFAVLIDPQGAVFSVIRLARPM